MKFSASQIYEFGAALAAAVAAGLVGGFALLKRMTLAGDVVSHLALPGIGIALVFQLNPVLGAGSTLLIGTLLVWGLEKKTGIATEAVIGVVFAGSLAAGALITPREDLEEALFGRLQPLRFVDFLIALAAACAINRNRAAAQTEDDSCAVFAGLSGGIGGSNLTASIWNFCCFSASPFWCL